MQLHQFRTDGSLDVTELAVGNATPMKMTALAICAHPDVTGVYRVQFVDEAYGRVAWDSYDAHLEPTVGTLMFAGMAA